MEERRAEKTRQRAAERARRTAQAWDGPMAVRTPHGEVVLESVAYRTDPASGVAYVDVVVGGQTEGGDPHFRVVNPPQCVEHPDGELGPDGRRYLEDPLAALAQAVAANGGAQARKRRMLG